jgi:beta-phosphoglucomutase-like phosphatase (HAD superfamily)
VGIDAACAAGMPVIAVHDPHLSPEAFGTADQVLRSLDEFDPSAWGLPPLHMRSSNARS